MTFITSHFITAKRGATIVDYGVIIALVAAVSVVTLVALGDQVSDELTTSGEALEASRESLQGAEETVPESGTQEWWANAGMAFEVTIGWTGNPNNYGFSSGMGSVSYLTGPQVLEQLRFQNGEYFDLYLNQDWTGYSVATLECELEGAHYTDDLTAGSEGPFYEEATDRTRYLQVMTSLPMPVDDSQIGKVLTCSVDHF